MTDMNLYQQMVIIFNRVAHPFFMGFILEDLEPVPDEQSLQIL